MGGTRFCHSSEGAFRFCQSSDRVPRFCQTLIIKKPKLSINKAIEHIRNFVGRGSGPRGYPDFAYSLIGVPGRCQKLGWELSGNIIKKISHTI